jgi:hypothetical protein
MWSGVAWRRMLAVAEVKGIVDLRIIKVMNRETAGSA